VTSIQQTNATILIVPELFMATFYPSRAQPNSQQVFIHASSVPDCEFRTYFISFILL